MRETRPQELPAYVFKLRNRFQDGDAELGFLGDILAGGRSSRLYQRLVYEEQLA